MKTTCFDSSPRTHHVGLDELSAEPANAVEEACSADAVEPSEMHEEEDEGKLQLEVEQEPQEEVVLEDEQVEAPPSHGDN